MCCARVVLQYPGNAGESGSDFVFIVDNPQELTIKFPIKGGHKICELHVTVNSDNTHTGVLICIQPGFTSSVNAHQSGCNLSIHIQW